MHKISCLVLLTTLSSFAEPQNPSLPLFFVPNTGQSHSDVSYLVQTPDLRAGFSNTGVIFQIAGTQLQVEFEGAGPGTSIHGTKTLGGVANFLTGSDSSAWRTGVPMFGQVRYRNLYPGIDATYEGTSGRVKSEFLVSPGANPRRIRMSYKDAASVAIESDGSLMVRAGDAVLREDAPVVYQDLPGGRARVAARYQLLDERTVGFALGGYDVRYPLVIDPTVTYSTYLGGSGMGAVTSLAVDSSGNLYAAGWTEAFNFPIAGAYQAASGGSVDAFVVKLNQDGTSPLYATYLGGSGDDRAFGIAVDGSGQAYIAGMTSSGNFPLAAPARNQMMGGREGFLVKLTAGGNGVLFSTFVGGNGYDAVNAVAVGGSRVTVGGNTQSTDLAIVGGSQTAPGGKMDGFIASYTLEGSLAYSTYLGGSNNEHLAAIAADSLGIVVAAGGTDSFNFPTLGALQGSPVGQDAFVTKIKVTAPVQVLYSTFLGGDGGSAASPEQANAVAMDASGNAYVAGTTNSNNFPVSPGALKTAMGGTRDAFVTKINATGTQRLYSTYLGGTSFDWANSIKVDGTGNAYIAGYTSSLGFTTVAPVQPGFNGLYDAFVTQLNATGNGILFSTFYGGSGADQANAIALDSAGNMFVGGQTGSFNFPTVAPLQATNTGNNTGWVTRMGVAAPPSAPPSADSANISMSAGNVATITAVFSHPLGATNLTTVGILVGNTPAVDFSCYVTYELTGNTFRLANNVAASGGGTLTPGSGTVGNDQCTLQGSGSSVNLSGNTMTVTVRLVLASGYPGPGSNTVYLSATDASATTGWVAKGGLPGPRVDSVSPSAATGSSQTFTFVFADNQAATNLTGMAILFNNSFVNTNGCYIVYDRIDNTIALLYDSAGGSTSRALGSPTPVSNSQCTVGLASAVMSGQTLTLNMALTFKPAFNGAKNIYMYATIGSLNTGWQQKGTYTVASGKLPTVNGVSPVNGGGPSGSLTFTVSDPGGSSYITGMAILFSTSLTTTNACYLTYDRAANRVSLVYDSGLGSSPITLGTSQSVANSQCGVNATGSSVSIGTTTVALTLNLTFNGSFAGVKNIYLLAAEVGINSGWIQVGSWTVTSATPTADSVNPSSGSGLGQTFVATVSDPTSGNNITAISMLVTGAGSANSCYVRFDRAANLIHLYNDAGTSTASKPLGSSQTLQNSQCAVGFTSRSFVGNSVILNVYLQFKQPAFTGAKTIYLQAHTAGASSGWVTRGTWSVP